MLFCIDKYIKKYIHKFISGNFVIDIVPMNLDFISSHVDI